MIPHITAEIVALTVGVITIVGAIVAAQWLYYWPKVQSVVERTVGDAMKREHEFVRREISRLDTAHDKCRGEVDMKLQTSEEGMRNDIKYIRGRMDWLIERIVNGNRV